jgi:hypothetical protein
MAKYRIMLSSIPQTVDDIQSLIIPSAEAYFGGKTDEDVKAELYGRALEMPVVGSVKSICFGAHLRRGVWVLEFRWMA